mmetsp:Transcript_26423/g.72666  ORF Transcript_26423/g.72666 Transcript_26423/m.72666 type:complete len:316 (-) Transcript_26423:210-1157(-)
MHGRCATARHGSCLGRRGFRNDFCLDRNDRFLFPRNHEPCLNQRITDHIGFSRKDRASIPEGHAVQIVSLNRNHNISCAKLFVRVDIRPPGILSLGICHHHDRKVDSAASLSFLHKGYCSRSFVRPLLAIFNGADQIFQTLLHNRFGICSILVVLAIRTTDGLFIGRIGRAPIIAGVAFWVCHILSTNGRLRCKFRFTLVRNRWDCAGVFCWRVRTGRFGGSFRGQTHRRGRWVLLCDGRSDGACFFGCSRCFGLDPARCARSPSFVSLWIWLPFAIAIAIAFVVDVVVAAVVAALFLFLLRLDPGRIHQRRFRV